MNPASASIRQTWAATSSSHRRQSSVPAPQFHRGSSSTGCCGHPWSAVPRRSAPCRWCTAGYSSWSRASDSTEPWSRQSAARGSKGTLPTSRPAPATPSSTSHVRPTRLQIARMPCSRTTARTPSRLASRLDSFRLRPQAVILKYLHAPVVRIHDVDRILAVDEQARRKLEISQSRSAPPEGVEKPSFAVEHLHGSPQPLDQIDVILGIDRDALGPIHLPHGIAHAPDLPYQLVLRIKDLHPEVHRVHDSQQSVSQPQFGWEVELTIAAAVLANRTQHFAFAVEHVHAVPQRVGNVEMLRCIVDRNSGRTLEVSFAALQATQRLLVFAIRIEHENLPAARVRDIDVVLRIHGHALRLEHVVFGFFLPLEEFVLVLRRVEDVHAVQAQIRHDHSPVRINGHAVRPHHLFVVGLARNSVEKLAPDVLLSPRF